MKITLDLTKSARENLAIYHERQKEIRKKTEGVEAAIAETKKEMEKAEKADAAKKKEAKVAREKKWFEKFHWFYTSAGKLAIGGRDAKQNDFLYSKHIDENDLFFHADIQGASAVILKDGKDASQEEKLEVAQFAASFSNAWKNGNAAVDVYAVKKDQLSKHATGGYIPAGGFAIKGEREWFRKTRLGLKLGKGGAGLELVPDISKRKLESGVLLFPAIAGKEKGALAKSLSKHLAVHPDELLQILPSGKTKTKI